MAGAGNPLTPIGGHQGRAVGQGSTSAPDTASPLQVGQSMVRNGFPRDVGVVADGIGVVMAESHGQKDAHNPSGADGYWQILGAHPACGSCGGGTATTRDLEKSTRCAACIWKAAGRKFSDWTTWHPGIGDAYQDAAKAAVQSHALVHIPNPLSGLDAVAGALEAIAKFFVGLGELLLTPEGWVRLAKLVAGAALVAIGVNRLAKFSLGVDPLGAVGHAAAGATAGALVGGPTGAVVGAVGSGLLGKGTAGAASKIASAAAG